MVRGLIEPPPPPRGDGEALQPPQPPRRDWRLDIGGLDLGNLGAVKTLCKVLCGSYQTSHGDPTHWLISHARAIATRLHAIAAPRRRITT